jgi:catechol 2,3-dioxygenase
MNHGNALSVYFSDPEGNTVGVCFNTPFYVTQPHGDPLDLSKTNEELLRETGVACRAAPCFLTAEEWRRRFVASNAGDSATKFQLA